MAEKQTKYKVMSIVEYQISFIIKTNLNGIDHQQHIWIYENVILFFAKIKHEYV